MSTIPARKFVTVNPNVLNAGGAGLDLIGLVLTQSTRVPIATVQRFPAATDVSNFFGPSSKEATEAAVYFNGFDGSSIKPAAMLFTQYPVAAVPAYLQSGNIAGLTLAAVQAMSGTLTVTMDGYPHVATNLNLAGATSFSAAAALIQAALDANEPTEAVFTGSIAGNTLTVTAVASGTLSVGQTLSGTGVAAGTMITALGTGTGLTGLYTVNTAQTVASNTITAKATDLTVLYDSVSGSLIFTSGVSGPSSTSAYATGTLAAPLFLTQATGAILSQGAAAAVPGGFMDGVVSTTQNWATFFTNFDPDFGNGNSVKLAFAGWTNNQNRRYGYIAIDRDPSPTQTFQATQSLGYLLNQNIYSGTMVIYEPLGQQLHHASFLSGAIASINFNTVNGRTTLAYRSQNGLIAGVTNETVASNLEQNGYNYYGAVATANQGFVFFYPGQISGPFQWIDSYVNQIWLNNALQLAELELLTQVGQIPYNKEGYALLEAAAADPINQGLNFGAIRAGVTLSQAQIAEVNNTAGKVISDVLQAQGYYFLVLDATPQVRQARQSPPIFFFYMDGESVQQVTIDSIDVQ